MNSALRGIAFFGRRTLLDQIEKRLTAFDQGFRQNVCILGPRGIGKSALLAHLQANAHTQGFLTISISCQPFDTIYNLSRRWMFEILYGAYRRLVAELLPESYHTLFCALKPVIPKTLSRMKLIRHAAKENRSAQIWRDLLGLTSVLSAECGIKILLLVDDFDFLGDLVTEDPYGTFGREMMLQKETMYLISGSNSLTSRVILSERLSLLFGNFEIVMLPKLNFEEAGELICDSRFKALLLEAPYQNFLIRLTDGHPYYLRLILERLQLNVLTDKERLTAQNLIVCALHDELWDSHGMLHQYFTRLIGGLSQGRIGRIVSDVLIGISLGHKKISDLSSFARHGTRDIKKALERLMQSEMLERHGSLHVLVDPLLKFWLAKVYYRERFMPAHAFEASAENFDRDVVMEIKKSIAADHEELPKRVELLFRQFQDELVAFGEYKLRCPTFLEVSSRPNNGRVFPVYGKSQTRRWLCQIVIHPVTEEDIRTFLNDLGKLNGSVHTKVIVGLRGIDLNAKLLAQEEKIQYFDLVYFNFLMSIFDQPKIIL